MSAILLSQSMTPSLTSAATMRLDETGLDSEAIWKTVSSSTFSGLPTSLDAGKALQIDQLTIVDDSDGKTGDAAIVDLLLRCGIELGQRRHDLGPRQRRRARASRKR